MLQSSLRDSKDIGQGKGKSSEFKERGVNLQNVSDVGGTVKEMVLSWDESTCLHETSQVMNNVLH